MLDFGFYNMDCMEGMKQFPDKYFDLAIVDPPYGDGKSSENLGGGYWNRFGQRFDKYKTLPLGQRTAKGADPTELVEHGRRSSEKNHNVGRSAGAGLF